MVAAIAGATPEQTATIARRGNKHKELMTQLGYENVAQLEQTTIEDRDSARKREAAVRQHEAANAALNVLLSAGDSKRARPNLHPSSSS